MSRQIKFIQNEMYEFEVYKLVDQYDPILKEKLEPYNFNTSEDAVTAKFHAISLLETMQKYHGVGLAANQVGLKIRMFVVGTEGVGYAFFNPEIISTEGMVGFDEGCLSFPGLFLPIKRPNNVTIKFTDMNGERKEQTFGGLTARVILHEYDHMDGIIYTSKISPLLLDRQKRKVKKNLKLLELQYQDAARREIIRQAAEKIYLAQRKQVHPDSPIELVDNDGKILIQ